MKKVCYDSRLLDKMCRQSYGLSEELMMEHAALSLKKAIEDYRGGRQSVLILCGKGNNGADGYALARLLGNYYDTYILSCDEPGTELCRIQKNRTDLCGYVKKYLTCDELLSYTFDIIVDCVFGSGFHGDMDRESVSYKALKLLQDSNAFVIACDVPSGMSLDGKSAAVLKADVTVAMGAIKQCQLMDCNKEASGKIICASLGVDESEFISGCGDDIFLLDENDMNLPYRKSDATHKGSYGHVYIASGDKSGAAIIAGKAALNFGAGRVTVVCPEMSEENKGIVYSNPELMISSCIGEDADVIVIGPGFGRDNKDAGYYFDFIKNHPSVKVVLDADCFYYNEIKELLLLKNEFILTPHPKELQSLIKICLERTYSVSDCLNGRFDIVKDFCSVYKNSALLAKGANTVTGKWSLHSGKVLRYVNTSGSACLAKAGSGDVLTGLIAALFGQNYSSENACITAGLAHCAAASKCSTTYGVTPLKIIDEAAYL